VNEFTKFSKIAKNANRAICTTPPVFTKGGPATEYVLLPIVQISQIWIPNRAEVLSCELFMSLQDPFCRFGLVRPNLSLFWFMSPGRSCRVSEWVTAGGNEQSGRTTNPRSRSGISYYFESINNAVIACLAWPLKIPLIFCAAIQGRHDIVWIHHNDCDCICKVNKWGVCM
jgi:hypothetical protein